MKRHPEDDPIGHLTNPIVTGGAIIALRCREGVVIATDTLLSYGGLLSIPSIIQSTRVSIAMKKLQTTSLSLRLESSLISNRQLAN
jgi:hypothetical protein